MTFNDLLVNCRAFANQSAGRVRTMHQGFGIMGSGAEQWDEERQTHRLPTPLEIMFKIRNGIGRPAMRGNCPRRILTDEEVRSLWKTASQTIRIVRKKYPEFT